MLKSVFYLLLAVAALLLSISASIVAAQKPCGSLIFHDTCLAANASSCMTFNGKCALTCSTISYDNNGDEVVTCTDNNPNCVTISKGNCRTKCSLITDPGFCWSTPGCYFYKSKCMSKCSGDSPQFSFNTEAQCVADNKQCQWTTGTCMTTCSVATDPTSCTLIDTGNCVWDYPSKKCLVSCAVLRSAGKSVCEDTTKTGGRCKWVPPPSDPGAMSGGCLPDCSRASTQTDCDSLSSSCIFIKDVGAGSNSEKGSCKLRCGAIPPEQCTSVNPACKIDDTGACTLFSCSRIGNRDFCSGTCQWIVGAARDSGKCVRSCEISKRFANSGVGCTVYDGSTTTLCKENDSTKKCEPASCASLTSAGSQVCLSQVQGPADDMPGMPRCRWVGEPGTCVDRCSLSSTFTLCGTKSYCQWGTTSQDPAGMPSHCFEKCSEMESAAACSASAQPAGCEWRYDSVQQQARCFASPCAAYSVLGGGEKNDKKSCIANSCTWTNNTNAAPSCSAPCASKTEAWSCVKIGCLWDIDSCSCGAPPSLLRATPSSCTCGSGSSSSSKCYVNSDFDVCALPPTYRPSVACTTTPPPTPAPTPAPPTRPPVTNANGSAGGGNSSADGSAGGGRLSTGVIVGISCAAVILLAISIYAFFKWREDKQDEADLILTSAEDSTARKFPMNVQMGSDTASNRSGAAAVDVTQVEYTHFENEGSGTAL